MSHGAGGKKHWLPSICTLLPHCPFFRLDSPISSSTIPQATRTISQNARHLPHAGPSTDHGRHRPRSVHHGCKMAGCRLRPGNDSICGFRRRLRRPRRYHRIRRRAHRLDTQPHYGRTRRPDLGPHARRRHRKCTPITTTSSLTQLTKVLGIRRQTVGHRLRHQRRVPQLVR